MTETITATQPAPSPAPSRAPELFALDAEELALDSRTAVRADARGELT